MSILKITWQLLERLAIGLGSCERERSKKVKKQGEEVFILRRWTN
jgi:hypothetical protein